MDRDCGLAIFIELDHALLAYARAWSSFVQSNDAISLFITVGLC